MTENPRGPVVYLLHFDDPLAHAQHYLGMARSFQRRFRAHSEGNGSKLMAAVTEAGIHVRLARIWRCETIKEAYQLEHDMKKRKNGRKLCPLCKKGK